jgi:hypothetical protein
MDANRKKLLLAGLAVIELVAATLAWRDLADATTARSGAVKTSGVCSSA